MAQHNPIAPQVVDSAERDINDTIYHLIWLLNVRRAELLDLVREKRAAEELRLETIKQLTDAQTLLHEELRQNINDRMIRILECKKRETILDTLGETRSELKCDTRELETIISRLGEIEQVPVYVPHYTTCHTSIVTTGKQGDTPGGLNPPHGVAIHEETHQIFIANTVNNRVEVFYKTGEFFHQLRVGRLSRPYGIATHGDIVYVSCWGDDTVSKFSLTELCCVRRIGGRGTKNGQSIYLDQLTTDPIGRDFSFFGEYLDLISKQSVTIILPSSSIEKKQPRCISLCFNKHLTRSPSRVKICRWKGGGEDQ